MNSESTIHVSTRGHLLTWIHRPQDRPVLTVELAYKWYTLQLLHPDGKVTSVSYPDYTDMRSPFVDHVPNPEAFKRLAEENDYVMDELAYEMIVGRWHLEV